MPALVLTDLVKASSAEVFDAVGKATLAAAGYVAFKIPPQAREPLMLQLDVTAGECSVKYSLSSDADFAAGTHKVDDVFDTNPTSSQGVEIPASVRAVIVTWVSGTIVAEVSAK